MMMRTVSPGRTITVSFRPNLVGRWRCAVPVDDLKLHVVHVEGVRIPRRVDHVPQFGIADPHPEQVVHVVHVVHGAHGVVVDGEATAVPAQDHVSRHRRRFGRDTLDRVQRRR
jgi:hypothetical protein